MAFFEKIRGWLPPHFRENDYQIYASMAGEILDDLKEQGDALFDETFISMANEEFLKIHAQERGFPRVSYGPTGDIRQETLEHWANRVRRIKYNRTSANILLNLETIVDIFNAQVVWDYPNGVVTSTGDKRSDSLLTTYPTANWGNFGPLDRKKRMNCFSVVIEFPVPPPLAHFDDKEFYDDKSFMDTRDRTFDQRTAYAIKFLIGKKVPAGSGWRLLIKGFNGLANSESRSIIEQEKDLNSF